MTKKYAIARGEAWWYILAALSGALAFVLRYLVAGLRFSAFLFCCAAVVAIVFGLLEHFSAQGYLAARWIRRGMLLFLGLGFAFFSVLEYQVVSHGLGEGRAVGAEGIQADAVIVLGAGVNGETPSLTLKQRILYAKNYILHHPGIPVVLSGGQGEGESITEAEAMRREMIFPESVEVSLLLEEKSTNTRENLRFSKEILEENGVDTAQAVVAVVSSDFHLYRAERIAREEGIQMVGIAAPLPSGWYYTVLTWNYYIREAFALAELLVFGG